MRLDQEVRDWSLLDSYMLYSKKSFLESIIILNKILSFFFFFETNKIPSINGGKGIQT